MIHWREGESRNIRLPDDGTTNPSKGTEVDDLRSFRTAIYESIIVTAMEMARLLCGFPYDGSYRYSRLSTVNLVRGARWDIFPYSGIEHTASPYGTEVSSKSERTRMVVICIPPWDLSILDLQEFATQMNVSM
jgi:hypothetical protein